MLVVNIVEETHRGLRGINIVGEIVCEYVSVGDGNVGGGSVGGVSGMEEGCDLSSVCVVGG